MNHKPMFTFKSDESRWIHFNAIEIGILIMTVFALGALWERFAQ